ncbi:carboxymuconolactone decarboxylase family protein [Nocardioides immobilis]|uniref:Carboxymuconolactone decarboxylase family protein n=1 Tax=Nocardioides immobilis TaxID=2049295 RepID=A0A417Y0Q2_9ACTN|nr:carboxymuconolactone decarboxylase family protein [Nocardioides immobilis]RHW26228.1 carboxymuconolactone decarboxylase family protein [Nocardioides immobilis]
MPVLEFKDPNTKILAAQEGFLVSVMNDGNLPRRLMEIIRLRIAFHNQCRTCMAVRYEDAIEDGVTEDLVCSLEKPHEAPDLTDAERAALRFADLFATNHLAIDEALVAELRRHFSERDIHEIAYSCACFVAGGRLSALSYGVDELPEYFQSDPTSGERLTPWGTQETVVIQNFTPTETANA